MRLLIFGLGYSGRAVAHNARDAHNARNVHGAHDARDAQGAHNARDAGWTVVATRRAPGTDEDAGVRLVAFDDAAAEIAAATHVLATAPPGEAGDPVLARYADALAAGPAAWFGYLSTTGVYGDRQGGWVDETTTPAPVAARSVRRLEAEQAWRRMAAGRPLDLFRLAGIYGPGRSAFDDLRAGRARRVVRPGHAFGRIHLDDIAGGVMAAIARPPAGTRVLNFSDDEPAESATVIAEAARLLGMPEPTPVDYAAAEPAMSEMARSFWAENRRVRSERTQAALGYRWRHPSFREGLRAILAREQAGDETA